MVCATLAALSLVESASEDSYSSDPLPIEFDPELVFLKPEKPLLTDLSPPALDEYNSFLKYLYRHDKDKLA